MVLVILLKTPPASGYELSVYDAYPPYFWIFISISIALGILILIIHSSGEQKSQWRFVGLGLVIFSNSILIGLPFFRGYGFWPAGDGLTHMGMMKDIVLTGRIGTENFYPVIHILGVNILEIAGLSEAQTAVLIFVFWNILYFLGAYLLSTIITDNRGKLLLITASTCPLLFSHLHVLLHPSIGSIFLMPLLFYFFFKSENILFYRKSYRVLLVILGTVIVFMHPITCLFAIIILVTFNITSSLFKYFNRNDLTRDEIPKLSNYNLPLIMLFIFCGWYLSSASIQGNIKQVYNFLSLENTDSLFSVQIGTLNEANISIGQTVNLFIDKYGAIFIYFGLALVAAIAVFLMMVRKNKLHYSSPMIFAVGLVVASAASAFSLWGFTGELDPVRVARFTLLVAPFIIGLMIPDLFTGKIRYILFSILLVAAGILSVFSVYGSPRTVETNLEATRMNIEGTKWFTTNRNQNIVVVDIAGELHRYEDYNFGYQQTAFDRAPLYNSIVPSQFGYPSNNILTTTLNTNAAYLLTGKASRINILLIPENVRWKAHDYGGQGFARLMMDPTVELIYSNGEFEAWKVSGK